MAPQTRSIINIYTVDPSRLSRIPAYERDGVPSDQHALRVIDVDGSAVNACVLFFGKAESLNLRAPAKLNGFRFLCHRGIIITAYRTFFKRFQALYAHVTGHRETFVFPYGCEHVALTQIPGPMPDDGSDVDSDGLRNPARYQDPSSSEEFNFIFRTKLLFNDRGKLIIIVLCRCVRIY